MCPLFQALAQLWYSAGLWQQLHSVSLSVLPHFLRPTGKIFSIVRIIVVFQSLSYRYSNLVLIHVGGASFGDVIGQPSQYPTPTGGGTCNISIEYTDNNGLLFLSIATSLAFVLSWFILCTRCCGGDLERSYSNERTVTYGSASGGVTNLTANANAASTSLTRAQAHV